MYLKPNEIKRNSQYEKRSRKMTIEELLKKRPRPEDYLVYKPTGIYGGEKMIYSEQCDDPKSMIIQDPETGDVYDGITARQAPYEIRRRLVNHCTKKGYDVMTTEEAEEALKRQTK